ncbi:aldo/keto reductase [Loigolactobacillus coryniformis]|jgi:diketogulonate reductase-like aldo/keto reductase|uniref:Aldo/keto reductase n=1 Tax=Loigolactobacillus coryniformis TaxID=1610 RepID=A0A5B8TIR3_9LACO|nr:aldo/keto reductase [Loigolactobacillus coryniformis]MBW4801473.1 aldo/keto reductase [Loigolactobacillus coryniformis subsp. torquens]MBW4804174.1 aldo/keto reductase [Loigolactobacillus coryniformis subsp. torquens]QEA52301.1 aldo/keto reductase [Loigolactobacillus coryniformis]RRG06904.1 MAG: aldo/keto reductase [Lactobacillus sp.]
MGQTIPEVTLNNGVKMPQFGLGVFKVDNATDIKNSIKWALADGYRLIDTAMIYQNEQWVGEAIKESGVPREDLFITSKLWNSDRGYEGTKAAFAASLQRLGLDYLDLYLIHWPADGYVESWRAMTDLYHEGKIRAIGVSNFEPHHIDDLLAHSDVVPVVDQIETHPLFQQKELHRYLANHQIAHEAWGPLGQGKSNILVDPVLTKIAAKYNKTTAQVVLRWHIDRGVIVIPKSIHEQRLAENANIFDFALTDEEMQAIAGLDQNKRLSRDPDDTEWLKKTQE